MSAESDGSDEEELLSTSVCAAQNRPTVAVRITDSLELHICQQLSPVALAPLFDDVWTGSQIWDCALDLARFMLHDPASTAVLAVL